MSKPVLEAIRELLKLKDYATLPEIAKLTKKSGMDVLRIVNKNSEHLVRNTKRGWITQEHTRSNLLSQWRDLGLYWTESPYNYGSVTVYRFNGHDDLREKLKKTAVGGGFGDSYRISDLKAHVFQPWDERAAPKA